MGKRHLKTITAPKSWPIKRKGQVFITRPNPGKDFSASMPLSLIFKNLLKYCKTSREVRALLRDKEVLVDARRRLNIRYSLGMMDVLSIPLLKENYRMMVGKAGKLYLLPIDAKESSHKVVRVLGKTVLKKGVVQLNLSDGRNVKISKEEVRVGDSLLLKVPDQKIEDVLKLEKGNYAYLFQGSHVGEHGKIEKVDEGKKGFVTIKTGEGIFETPKEYAYVVGKEKPAITVEK